MNLYVVLFDVNRNIALFKNKNDYNLPCCKTVNGKNNELTLCEYLKKEFGLNAKEEDFKLKVKEDKNLYYYCYNPYFIKEFKHNLNKITWIKEDVLKDVLTNLNTTNSNKLIEVLTKILKSNFSFSKTERKYLINKIKDAKESNDALTYNYYLDTIKSKLLNKNNQSEIDKRYQEQLRILKKQETQIKEENNEKTKYECYLEELKSTDLIYLTEKEAKLIGKYDEWDKIMTKAFELQHFIPSNPNGDNMFLFDAEIKLQEKDDITPNVLFELASKYKNRPYEEVKENLQELLNNKKKESSKK